MVPPALHCDPSELELSRALGTNASTHQGPSGSGSIDYRKSQVEYDSHGWYNNQAVGDINNAPPLAAPTSLSSAEVYDLEQAPVRAAASVPGQTPHSNLSGPGSQLPHAPTTLQGSHVLGLLPQDPISVSDPAGEAALTCKWRATNGSICGASITGSTVPQHLVQHGITKLSFDTLIECHWCPNGSKPMKRESIVRHVRGVHLHLTRKSAHRQSARSPRGS
ncbi:hypothetical protein PAXRUDRAFT_413549 [Paxillus rubicundulus Ve08.2h10]|uniref:Uncharacterized protein n=1 Tax=Paxillus rubicundulus Ve08.2h10 TaxID=930991 RepID=A0A0D0C0A3_9AGAM|nr:hypothetical protein PAXRUDRAFT_413549 [Paxillus rubicundulus Ve08.2h10]